MCGDVAKARNMVVCYGQKSTCDSISFVILVNKF
jgi:hypothetical protein